MNEIDLKYATESDYEIYDNIKISILMNQLQEFIWIRCLLNEDWIVKQAKFKCKSKDQVWDIYFFFPEIIYLRSNISHS